MAKEPKRITDQDVADILQKQRDQYVGTKTTKSNGSGGGKTPSQ